MVIKRKGGDYGLQADFIKIELTSQELEQAYRIKEREYRQQEAELAFSIAYENGQVSAGDYEHLKNDTAFYERLLEEYDRRFSCDLSENAVWEITIGAVLKSEHQQV